MLNQVPYFSLFSFILLTFVIAFIIYRTSLILTVRTKDVEKLSEYECGFEALEDIRRKFEIRFYLISILFLVFDLEIMFLFPWSQITTSFSDYIILCIFLGTLTIGFFYEWEKGALDWD